MLEDSFKLLLKNYTHAGAAIGEYWKEINTRYSEPHRHYHTLSHLTNLLKELTGIRTKLENWEAMLFALYYHDIIYDPLQSDNEEQSAALAGERMTQINVPDQIIGITVNAIMATRSHTGTGYPDINYFKDADLSVLGQSSQTYKEYSNAIRKEYIIYPDAVYWPARKKVLLGFLQMDRLFTTDIFYRRYEEQARMNLTAEVLSIDNRAGHSSI